MSAFREFERRGHDRVAPKYLEFFEPATAAVVDDLLDGADIVAGMRVLDVATGPGRAMARAAERGAHAVGIDLSSTMVEVASARYPHLDFRQGDAEALPFDAEAFDAVICNFGIAHFPQPERAASEFARVLRPEGKIAISWWSLPGGARLNGIFLDAVAEAEITPPPDLPPGPPIVRYSDERQLRSLFLDTGLEQVSVRDVSWTHPIAGLDEWWQGGLGSLVRTSAMILSQPADVQRRVRRIFDRLAEPYRRVNAFSVPMAAKIASGRKPLSRGRGETV